MMLGPHELKQYLHKTAAEARLLPVDVETPTVEAAARAVGAEPEKIVKSLIFIVDGEPILVITAGKKRVPLAVLARKTGIAKESIRLAKPREVSASTGYPVGAVPPFGHKAKLAGYMDAALLELDLAYAGGGAADHLLRVSPAEILRLSGADVIELRSGD
jgi:prolyl-tRNA editing enzyme YbaK/EbsC (Cys-tRNA(Pro) deacylase)